MTLAEQLLGTMLPPDLLPETQDALRDWSRRQMRLLEATGKPVDVLLPSFPFQHLPDSQRLSYELVDWHNYPAYLLLFANDPSPFVEARFKQHALLETYAVELLTDMRYSWKRGGGDWLLRRRIDGRPMGVLHLYELSHEVIGGRVPHCCVGYAVAAPFRRQGIGREALSHLLVQAAHLFGRTEARALINADNTASDGLLRGCGFTLLEERPAGYGRNAGQLWHRLLG
jgi:RimJ/RimL family protein N-acetyltransferase